MTKYNSSQWAFILFVTLGSITYGYSSSIISTTLGQPTFLKYFGLDSGSDAASLTGAINGLFYAGGLIGSLSTAYTADRFGRRVAMFMGAALAVVGGALQAGSMQIAMFIVARFLTGIGIGMLLCLVPLYQSELAPPKIRGMLVGTHGIVLCVGYSFASWFGVAFYFVNVAGAQWRIPLALQCIFPLCLCLGISKMPESPRYLIRRERVEDAYAAFKSVYGGIKTENDDDLRHQFDLLHLQIRNEKRLATKFIDLATHPSLRKRCIVGFLTCFAGQATATMVISNYGAMLYKSLNFDSLQQLCLQAGWITICPFGNLFNALVVDKVGRVKMIITGLTGCVLCLVGECITVALFEQTRSKGCAAAAVVFLFLHLVSFSSFIDATSYIYSSEIFPTPVRAKGLAVSVSGLFVATIIFLSGAPTAFAAISWKYYIVFITCSIVFAIIAFLYFPETKAVPLEEIGAIFGDQVEYEVQPNEEKDISSSHHETSE